MKRSELIKIGARTSKTIFLLKADNEYIANYATEFGREKKALFLTYDIAKERADEIGERLGKQVTVVSMTL